MSYLVHVDGLCESRNPGGVAAWGFTIHRDGHHLVSLNGVVGEGLSMTNNVAEYSALAAALSWLLNFTKKDGKSQAEVEVRGDSMLVINQMRGTWQIRGGSYLPYCEKAKTLRDGFARPIRFTWVPREQNQQADTQSKLAYEKYCEEKGRVPRYMSGEMPITRARPPIASPKAARQLYGEKENRTLDIFLA